jgi:UDP-N-acetylmuramate dehydrogenase
VSLEVLERKGLVKSDYPLAGTTTYKFGGPAAWYAEVGSLDGLTTVLSATDLPCLVIGRGSNMVISDAGYPGLVVRLVGEFNEVDVADGVASAGAGVALPRLARSCAAADRGGLEFFVGIPGSVGGAVVMNAGGHGSDTAEWLIEALVLDLLTGRVKQDDATGLELSYRHSRLQSNHIVLSARFRTIARPKEESEALMREITTWRKQYQPGGTLNAGSVFKNPPGDAAGRIIDELGLKGLRVGGVAISDRHANFFVADASARAQDVFDLVHRVQQVVAEQTGVVLQPEVRFVGDFGEST